MTSALVYLLCGLTSAVCAILLLRSYARSRLRLLLWSGIGFAAFTANNIMLFLDRVVYLHIDFTPYRSISVVLGIGVLLYGLIWES